jgi:hypothetical protein
MKTKHKILISLLLLNCLILLWGSYYLVHLLQMDGTKWYVVLYFETSMVSQILYLIGIISCFNKWR